MKYLFYAIVFDVAGNTTAVGSSASPAKTITTNIQKVTGISINPSGSLTKNIGDTFKITVTVSPSDANNKGINWSSSTSSVATVDNSGNIRCLAAGTTTITATAADGSGISASLTLTVRNPINSLTLDKDQTTILKDGYTSTVTATTDPENYDGANISWTIADTSIATVAVSGKTATIKSTSKVGQTTLTVSAGGLSKTVSVSVVNFVTTTYEYTGSVQQVDLPAGTYKLECWGAQGGKDSHYTADKGGAGGYATGIYNVISSTKVYIVVGKKGKDSGEGGYNGGGSGSSSSGGGGGATHIGLKSGLLNDFSSDYSYNLLIVAGGGGGHDDDGSNDGIENYRGGCGGGFQGESGHCYMTGPLASPGTQTSGFSFGKGQNSSSTYCGGGGGGFYGGYAGTSGDSSGAGGSGYINTNLLSNAYMYGYKVPTSSETTTKTYSTTNYSSSATSNYAKFGDGCARITPVN